MFLNWRNFAKVGFRCWLNRVLIRKLSKEFCLRIVAGHVPNLQRVAMVVGNDRQNFHTRSKVCLKTFFQIIFGYLNTRFDQLLQCDGGPHLIFNVKIDFVGLVSGDESQPASHIDGAILFQVSQCPGGTIDFDVHVFLSDLHAVGFKLLHQHDSVDLRFQHVSTESHNALFAHLILEHLLAIDDRGDTRHLLRTLRVIHHVDEFCILLHLLEQFRRRIRQFFFGELFLDATLGFSDLLFRQFRLVKDPLAF